MIGIWNQYRNCNVILNPGIYLIKHRGFNSTSKLFASSGDVGNTKYKHKGKKLRQDRIDKINMESHTKLYYIDNKFNIFNSNVKKVLDLGYVPGNWSQYAKFRLCQIHGLEEEDFHKKCHMVGFDLLFGNSIKGISSIQGNIYSKSSQQHIIDHFKGLTKLKEFDPEWNNDNESYFVKEANIEEELSELDREMRNMTLESHNDLKRIKRHSNIINDLSSYGTDLILSDLGTPFLQLHGFFNNTTTRPYIRFNSNKALQKPITATLKSSLDLADASLLLTCKLLKPGGTFLVRLPEVNLNDSELEFYEQKLHKVFNTVKTWHKNGLGINKSSTPFEEPDINELFFVCKDKKEAKIDTDNLF